MLRAFGPPPDGLVRPPLAGVRAMDAIERHAENFLLSQFQEVTFEPLGQSRPPDFLGDDRVAIEVRRLNRNTEYAGNIAGLESIERKLSDAVSSILEGFGSPDTEKSWFVSYSFQRPLPKLKKLKSSIQEALGSISDGFAAENTEPLQLHENFKLMLSDAGVPLEQKFEFGGYCDLDSGGWVQSELIKNVQICMDEKAKKMRAIEDVYNEWWLVLVDYVSLAIGPSFLDIEFLKSNVTIPRIWDKVVLLSPSDHCNWNEL